MGKSRLEPQWGDILRNKNTGELTKYYPCHPGQLDVLNSNARYLAALGGVGSGKTSLGCLWLSREIARLGGESGKEYLIVTPKYGTALSATLPAWQKCVEGTALEGKSCDSASNLHYRLGTGGKIYFASANASFDGVKPWACLFDEGGDTPISVFHAIQRRLAGRSGRCCISTTPYAKFDWLRTDFIERADSGDPDYFYRCFPSLLNPSFPREDYEDAKRSMPSWEFEMFLEGKFSKAPGQVYDLLDKDGNAVGVDYKLDDLQLDDCSAIIGAIDWGGNDPTAIILGAFYPDQTLTIFWECYQRNMDIGQVIDQMTWANRQLEKRYNKTVKQWYCDHRPDNIKALMRAGFRNALPVPKGPGSVAIGISLVRARMRTGKLKIVRGSCPNLLKEATNYRYPTVEGKPVGDKPIPGDDHALDAMSYLVRGLDRKEFSKMARLYKEGREYEQRAGL